VAVLVSCLLLYCIAGDFLIAHYVGFVCLGFGGFFVDLVNCINLLTLFVCCCLDMAFNILLPVLAYKNQRQVSHVANQL